MLPRQHRLLLRKDPTFFVSARRVSSTCMSCFYRPAEKFSAAIIVPKKQVPSAAKRHLLKRQVSHVLTELLLKTGRHLEVRREIVVSLKKECAAITLPEMKLELEQLLTKIT